jgi:hypothetical protein
LRNEAKRQAFRARNVGQARQKASEIREEGKRMATTTFDKNIVIDKNAAKRLVEILSKPAPKQAKSDKKFWEENEQKVDEWLSRFKK